MVDIDTMREQSQKLCTVQGWPADVDGPQLLRAVLRVVSNHKHRSYKSIADSIQLRHRVHGHPIHPSTRSIKWALTTLGARKPFKTWVVRNREAVEVLELQPRRKDPEQLTLKVLR